MDSTPFPKPPSGTAVAGDPAAGLVPPLAPCVGGVAPNAPQVEGALLLRLLEHAPQPFGVTDLDGRFRRTNRAFQELTGYSAAELLTMTLSDLTPKPWRAKMSDVFARIVATGAPARYEKEYLRKDGRLVPIEAAVDLFHDDSGNAAGFFAFVTDLTERKHVETALRDSEERYRRLYDEAPVGYHELDREGRIVGINITECEMLGYSRGELLGRALADFLAPELRDDAVRVFRESIARQRPLMTLERTFVRRNGTRLPAVVEERYSYDAAGRVAGLRGTVLDITDRQRAECALVAAERRARALFEGIEDAVFVHSPEGRILDANPAASRLLGYSHTELLALSTRDIDAPDFAQGYEQRLAEQLARGRLACEGRHRTKFGRVIPVEINTAAIQFGDERAVLAVVRDITERKALEATRHQLAEAQARIAREMEAKNQALTESEARYRQLTESSLDAVVLADAAGRIALFNHAAERIFGYQASEVIGQPVTILVPPKFREAHTRGLTRFVETRVARLVGRTVELRALRKSGEEFPIELSLNAIDSAGELQFIGSIRDQTERHRMREMLVQSEKLASIGLLSAGVAHEINNPLAYVANNLAVLERDVKGLMEMLCSYEGASDALSAAAPEVAERVRAISDDCDWPYVRDNLGRMLSRTREGVQRVANIVQSLRSLARTSPPKMEPARITDMVDSALEVLRGRLKHHHIDLAIEHGEVGPVVCVPTQISQVILNLLINASQAIESQGKPDGGQIRVCSRREGEHAVIIVSDNGCGIAPEDLPKLYDPFFTTKPVGEGTGLGLSISHGIITGHGGRIEVESAPGAGTSFRIVLPVKPPRTA